MCTDLWKRKFSTVLFMIAKVCNQTSINKEAFRKMTAWM